MLAYHQHAANLEHATSLTVDMFMIVSLPGLRALTFKYSHLPDLDDSQLRS